MIQIETALIKNTCVFYTEIYVLGKILIEKEAFEKSHKNSRETPNIGLQGFGPQHY